MILTPIPPIALSYLIASIITKDLIKTRHLKEKNQGKEQEDKQENRRRNS